MRRRSSCSRSARAAPATLSSSILPSIRRDYPLCRVRTVAVASTRSRRGGPSGGFTVLSRTIQPRGRRSRASRPGCRTTGPRLDRPAQRFLAPPPRRSRARGATTLGRPRDMPIRIARRSRRVERVAQRRADGLVDRAAAAGADANSRSREIGVVDVAGEQDDAPGAPPRRACRRAIRSSRSSRSRSESPNAAQCSRSSAAADALADAAPRCGPTRPRRRPRSRPRGGACRGRGTRAARCRGAGGRTYPRVHALDAVPLLGVDHVARARARARGRRASPSPRCACGRGRGGSSSARPRPRGRRRTRTRGRSARRRRSARAHGAVGRVVHPVLGREVAEVLVDPVGHERRRRCARPTSRGRGCRATQSRDVFQSSWTSWSSKIIAVGTVDSSQRTAGSVHESWYRRQYSSKSATSSPGGTRHVAAGGDELGRRDGRPRRRRPGRRAGAAGAASPPRPGARMRIASARSASCSRPRGSSSLLSVHGGSFGWATRQEPKAIRRSWSSPIVRMHDGGQPVSSGQTRSPSRRTSYGRACSGSRPVTCTRAK